MHPRRPIRRMSVALGLGVLVAAGCGDDSTGDRSASRAGKARAPAIDAVPVPHGARVVFNGAECPVSPGRCIRSAVLEGRPGQSSAALSRAHGLLLGRARWRRIPACASPLPQYEDPRREVEIFLKPSRRVMSGQSSTPALSDSLEAAIRESERAGRATVVLEIAEATQAPPC